MDNHHVRDAQAEVSLFKATLITVEFDFHRWLADSKPMFSQYISLLPSLVPSKLAEDFLEIQPCCGLSRSPD